MYHIPELNELSEALEASPQNQTLRYLLVKKLYNFSEYKEQFEHHIQILLKQAPNHYQAKDLLMKHYFQQQKLSACIILGEELMEAQNLSQEGYLILAKSYMKEGNSEKARDIYQEAIILDPDLTDEELDNAFRVGAFEEFDFDDEMDDGTMEKPNINFSDVGGLEDVKREIDLKIIKPLAHADLYAQYGKKVGGGILLYGPPGCGKTYLSKATAGQIDAKFINVGLNDILDMWLGSSEQKLHNFFSLARRNTPCVLFFDEIDALGAKRSDMRQSAGKTVINQFLSELDGVETSNEGILIIGATNCPWHLDPAFRRPGRFDRIIFVPPPDTKGKEEILKILLKNKPTDQIDYLKVAKKTKDYSGADLEALIDIAIEKKLEKAIETGVPEPLRTADLLQAIDSHKPSTVDWFTTAKNYAMFANQSGLYDDILSYLNK
ncbi:MAG: AAA family ATPase [Saprospiraceae bacterium]|nr:AAA family ATPase [Saprospiraceae bacterium]